MKCQNCGNECPDGVKFCSKCGTPLQVAPTPVSGQATVQSTNEAQAAQQLHTAPQQSQGNNVHASNQAGQMNQAMPTFEQPVQPNQAYQNIQTPVQPNQAYQNNQAPVQPKSTAADKLKQIPKKTLMIAGGALVALILVIVIFSKLLGGGSPFTKKSANSVQAGSFRVEDEHKLYSFNTKGDVKQLNAEDNYSLTYNLDSSVCAYLDDEDTLYVLNGDGETKVAEEVNNYALSDSGKGIAYVVDDELYLYNVAKKSSSKVTAEVNSKYIAISPDGNTVAFVKDYESDSEFKLCMSVNGKDAETIGKTKKPVAVSDKGKYLYYLDDDGKLVVKNGDDTQKISSSFDGTLYLNQSYTQAICNDDEKCYISIKAGEKKKISNKEFYGILLPNTTATRYAYSGANVTVYGVSNLYNQIMALDGSGYYVPSNLEPFKIATSGISYGQLAEDGKGFIYSQGGSLYYISNITKEGAEPKELASDIDIDEFVVSSDLTYVYYTNDDDELMCVKGSKKPVKIADEVEDDDYIIDTTDNTVYFLTDTNSDGEGTLYYSKKGSDKKAVKGADDVRMTSYADRIYCIVETDDTYELMLVKGGKATTVIDGITSIR